MTAELPGVEEKDIELTLANGLLTIRGEKKTERDEKDTNKNWHVIERSYGAFSRSIALPFEPASDRVDKGVLWVHLSKPPEVASKQQRIAIKKG